VTDVSIARQRERRATVRHVRTGVRSIEQTAREAGLARDLADESTAA